MCSCASRERAADRCANFACLVNANRELAADWQANSTCYVNATLRVPVSSRFTDGHSFAQAGTGQ